MGKRKRYTAEEKVKILRELLEEGKQISQVAEKYGLSPNNIFKWRKQLFEEVQGLPDQEDGHQRKSRGEENSRP